MAMSVIMYDSLTQLTPEDQELMQRSALATVLYADGTLLISVSEHSLQRLLHAVATTGARFGMQLHWGKFQLLNVRCDMKVCTEAGEPIAAKDTMGYLGATLSADGRVDTELSRRIGAAWAEFRKLDRLWKHTTLPAARKLSVFQAIVAPGLLYSLSTTWLNMSQQRRLNGFQARCLRRILRVKPSFVSRVSNERVRQMAGHSELTQQLLSQQLSLIVRVARAPDTDMLRELTFVPGTLDLAASRYIRKRGRPRLEWASCLTRVASNITSANETLSSAVSDGKRWRQRVHQYCNG